MIVYEITENGGDGRSYYYATLAEAREAFPDFVDADAEVFGGPPEIEKLTLVDLPPRALAVRLLNGEAWVAEREAVSP